MSTNQAQPGRIVNIIAGGAVVSGSVNVVGNYIGVALNSAAASGDVYPLAVEGVFTLAKKTGETWADGDKLYWDASAATASNVYISAAAGNFVGVADAIAASAATTGPCKLRGGAKTLGAVDGSDVATVATGNLTGGVPVVHVLAIPAGATTTAFIFVKKTRILILQALKTVSAGTASGVLTIKNGANAITNAATWDNSTTDKSVVPFGAIDDAYYEIAAGGTLNITTSHATSSGILTIIGINVA